MPILSIEIPQSHPRKESLITRELLIEGYKKGLVCDAGLIAHGRGEAFDYLLGERTHSFACDAADAAVSMLLLAKHPVISCNGNTAALCSKDLIYLSELLSAPLEVNLFYKSFDRVQKIVSYLKDMGAKNVLGEVTSEKIPKLESKRAEVSKNGIFKADVVFVPLEDGDRTEALKTQGKKVITVDLNPLSRTAQCADITIVDNIVRALPLLIKKVIKLRSYSSFVLEKILKDYNNTCILNEATTRIRGNVR